MTQAEQLRLFPFCPVAQTTGEFLLNLFILSSHQDGGEFTVKLQTLEDRQKFLERALAVRAYMDTQSLLEPLADVDLSAFAEKEGEAREDPPFLLCKERMESGKKCGAPAIYHLECSCGTYAWCKKHRDDAYAYWDHADHECSPECCKWGHAAEEISVAELEASIPTLEVLIQITEDPFVFAVKARWRSEEERLRELNWLMGCFSVAELDGLEELLEELGYLSESNCSPLAVGQKVTITPDWLWGPQTLALGVVRLNQHRRLVAQVVARDPCPGDRSGYLDEYTLLLPEGATIPGHSKPFDETGQHRIVLSRFEIRPISISQWGSNNDC